ncbi:MAG: hypothetical protein LBJ67_12435 [Planctomycetaceae bacterium]|nr:hypothetical protein [Planctomycetaceae bacterium]
MNRAGRFKKNMIAFMAINVAVAVNFYCYAQTGRQNPVFMQRVAAQQYSPQTQSVFQDYSIVRVSAAEASRELQRVFGQRPISVDCDLPQNRLLIWASESEHVQIQHLLQQSQILGLPTKNPLNSGFASFVRQQRTQQNPRNSVAQRSGERFADYHRVPGDSWNNVSAVWQQQVNANGQSKQTAINSQVRQVSGYAQEQPPTRLPEVSSPFNNQRSVNVGLRNINAAMFEQKLHAALENRKIIPAQTHNTSGFAQYRIPTLEGQFLDLAVDRAQNIVSITGQNSSVEAFANVVTMFDSNPKENASVVFVSPSNEAKVRDVAQVMNQVSQLGNAQLGTTVTIPPTNMLPINRQSNPSGTELRFTTNQATTGNAENPAVSLTPPDVTGIVGPINVSILDGGVVVITGPNAREVELVKSLIEYITLVSKEYEPVLELVPMIHADCNRVAIVLQQLYPQLYGTSRGEISITALFRPNTILLIGYQGSIDAAKELIAKLDSPIDAEAQFQIFRLKHASSTNVKTTLDAFYQGRTATPTTGINNTLAPGLASTVTVVSDYRTNSVIVQAAPRDLVEIAAMVMKLDLSGNEVNTQVKIIPLRNTRAEDMASVVMQALTGRTSTIGGFGGGITQQTGERSSGLQFTAIDASKGERVLNAGIFTDVRVVADPNGNKLIVTAPEECLPLIEAVVGSLDIPPLAKAQVKVFTIINSDVTTLVTMLQTIFTTTQQTGGTNSVTSYSMGGSTENSALVPVRFASDSRTNSIIAVGSEDMLAMVEAVLLTLDEPELQNRRMMIYTLLNTEASAIATALQTFLQNERQLRQQAQIGVGEYDLFNSEIIITPETSTNKLMVSTTPRHFEQLRKMIQVLDERPPMVQIQVVIAEVDISSMNEFGVELGLQDSLLFDRSVLNSGDFQTLTSTTNVPGVGSTQEQTIISQSTRPGYNFNDLSLPLGNNTSSAVSNTSRVGSQGITNFAVGRQSSNGAGGFVFSASSESISVLVRALEESQRLTVLNRPMLNVLHNQTATLQVGQLVPYITSASVDSITGNQSNLVDNREVGIGLQVTPRISLDDTVALQIQAQKSSMDVEGNGTPIFVQGGQVIRSPRVNSTTINTVISTKSGQVAVLGGLISQEDQSTRRAVPYISRIPLVGQLFQYNYKNSTRKEVIFIFIPRVYRSEEEMDAIKNLEFARMHWCAAHVAGLIDTNDVKTRFDDFNSSETVIERGSDVLLNELERPSDSKVIDNATQHDVTLPRPVMAPSAPKK